MAERTPGPGSTPSPGKVLPAKALPGRRGRLRAPATNQEALEALKRSSDEAERRALRDQLVRNNLPLVYAITARMGRTLSLSQDDLRQIGSLGLLRAIEAFEPSRGRSLSSFAVPYIRGAIQHELRDRASLMRIPRPLWELRRRATVLQDRRRRLGQPQLAPAQLAEALECSPGQVVEALQIGSVVEMRSLDAPSRADTTDEGAGRSLLDLLPDPASLVAAEPEGEPLQAEAHGEPPLRPAATPAGTNGHGLPGRRGSATAEEAAAPDARSVLASTPQAPTGWPPSPERSWLDSRLESLTVQERALLDGHVGQGRSWAELGRELGLHPRQAQRRTVALLSRLVGEASRWRDNGAGATS